MRYGYTAEEKASIRAGIQCPECFGVAVEARTKIAFQCTDCGRQWHATDPQFQSADRHPIPPGSILVVKAGR